MNGVEEHVAKKARKAPALPTQDEQKQLQQMEILMKSNLLQLQSKELLANIDATSKFSSKRLNDWLEVLKTDLQSTAKFTCHNREISDEWLQTQPFGISLDFGSNNVEPCSITYKAPTRVEMVGSFDSCTGTAPLFNVDVAVFMPDDLFAARDILNHAYFQKRALYLAALRKSLEQVNKKTETKYKNFKTLLFKADCRKPIIQLQPQYSESIVVRLILVLPEHVVKPIQLRESKNNVRPDSWMKSLKDNRNVKDTSKEMDASALPPTPQYNLAILEDLCIPLHHQIISKIIKSFENVTQTLILLKVWLTQRDIRFSPDGLDGHQAALLIAYLIQTKRITPQSAAVSAFQTVLSFFAATDFGKVKLDFSKVELASKTEQELDALQGAVVLTHPVATERANSVLHYNCLWRVSASTANILRMEAQRSMLELQGGREGSAFDQLFMRRRSFFDIHDAFLHFSVSSWKEAFENGEAVSSDAKDAALHWQLQSFAARRAQALVTQALGDRALHVHTCIRSRTALRLSETVEDHSHVEMEDNAGSSEFFITVGVILDKEKATRKVERGPSPSATNSDNSQHQRELEAFRAFWGDKCQLRRFKDGSIVESVVWDSADKSRRAIDLVEDVSKFILARHLPWLCGNAAERVHCINSQFQICKMFQSTRQLTGSTHFYKAVEALDELRGIFVSKLKGLPINYDNLLAVSPELRYTALYPPITHPLVAHPKTSEHDDFAELRAELKTYAGEPLSNLVAPIRVFAKFESSSKWPLEEDAIEKCKTAFLLKTRTELLKQFQIVSVVHEDSLDVCYKGFLFRLVPFAGVDTEKIIFRSVVGEQDSNVTTVQIANNEWLLPPLHHNAIKALQSQYMVFGETVQLVKLWLARHHFSGHLSHECVELLVAFEFVHGSTLVPPTTPFAGLLRALSRLCSHDWEEDPFIVDISGAKEITADTRAAITMRFRAIRTAAQALQSSSAMPASVNPSMYIISSSDKINNYEPSLSAKAPERVVLTMIVNAARSSVKLLKSWVEAPETSFEDGEREPVDIFSSDSILKRCQLQLQFSKYVSCSNVDKGPAFARLQTYANVTNKELMLSSLTVIDEEGGANTIQAQIIEKLKSTFKDHAIFFWDETSGKDLGVLLRPKFTNESDFTVLNSQFKSPRLADAKDLTMTANTGELLHQIIAESNALLSIKKM